MKSEINHPLSDYFHRHRFLLLLAGMVLFLFSSSVMQYLDSEDRVWFTAVVLITYLILVLTGAAVATQRMSQLVAASIMAALIFITAVLEQVWPSRVLFFLTHLATSLFLVYIQFLLIRFLFSGRRVDMEVINASLCGYVLLAVLWSEFYLLAEVLEPGSYYSGQQDTIVAQATEGTQFFHSMYFSIVTLTTLGYGDITPVRPLARTLAGLEAVVGQVYLTVLIARLVGLHIAHSTAPQESSHKDTKE